MAAESSFDIVSQVERMEVRNAVQQATKEVRTRFDFKGSSATIEESGDDLVLSAEDEGRLKALKQILEEKLARRGVSLKAVEWGKVESALGGSARQRAAIQSGLSSEQAKDVVKRIKGTGLKVQAAIQGEQVRVSAKKKDDLQAVIAHLREADLSFDWKPTNYR
ncbi:MAG TPA: YajQ family cyclic di-GMP-binding protein [Gemmatimonadota bacterium]|nr:YajQ family cyclic di-GMP-binding protein [Gemmatimonadota bacterium]